MNELVSDRQLMQRRRAYITNVYCFESNSLLWSATWNCEERGPSMRVNKRMFRLREARTSAPRKVDGLITSIAGRRARSSNRI